MTDHAPEALQFQAPREIISLQGKHLEKLHWSDDLHSLAFLDAQKGGVTAHHVIRVRGDRCLEEFVIVGIAANGFCGGNRFDHFRVELDEIEDGAEQRPPRRFRKQGRSYRGSL
jgi:hypothetical protein